MLRSGAILLAAWAVGCGTAPPGISQCVDGGHPPFPQVSFQGGTLVANPELVTITFAGYDLESEIQRFGDWVVGPDWLPVVGAEYGIGVGTHLAKVVLQESAPSSLPGTDVAAFLDRQARAGTIPKPSAAHPDLIYALYFPSSTVLTLGARRSCKQGGFGGFHDHGMVVDTDVPFVVLPECSVPVSSAGLTVGHQLEVFASHEVFEVVTDPFAFISPGYRLDTQDPWAVFFGPELSDLCLNSIAPVTPEGFRVQRVWSNAAAQDGGSPCIPVTPGESYFNVSPTPAGPLKIGAGESVDVEVQGWSTLPGTSWSLSAYAQGDFQPTLPTDLLGSVKWPMSDCTSITLHIAVPPFTLSGSQTVVLLVSESDSEPDTPAFWPIQIMVP